MSALMDGNPTTLLIVLTLSGFFTLALTMMMFLMRQRELEKKYDFEERRAVLGEIRKSYETRIDELVKQLTATPQRFKDVNHLVIEGQDHVLYSSDKPVASNEFVRTFGLSAFDLVIDQKLVFVLTPFHDNELSTFNAIRETCSMVGLRALRGDEENAEGAILAHIVKYIAQARIIIANIGSRNPNVFYELGIAHALGKDTILVAKSISDVPFDVSARRIVVYENDNQLRNQLLVALAKYNLK